MGLTKGELTRRRILATLKTRGNYMSMENLCKKPGIPRGTVAPILSGLIARGHVRKKLSDSGYGYALTHAGTLEFKKLKLKE